MGDLRTGVDVGLTQQCTPLKQAKAHGETGKIAVALAVTWRSTYPRRCGDYKHAELAVPLID